MNKFISWMMIFSLSASSFAEQAATAAAGSSPRVTRAQALGIANTAPGQCSFEPQLTADDKTLLENAKNAITALRQNSKCNVMASQFDAFQEALKAYNQQTGADRVPGYDGNLNVTCSNYDSIYDSSFGSFTDNWDDPSTVQGTDVYYNCRSKTTRDEAIECAALITGRQKNLKKAQCDAQKDAIQAQAMSQLLNHTYTTGLEAVQAILNNKECIDSAGEQKLSFIQSAVTLASRAASLSVLGTGVGLLVGAASQVVGSAIKNFFVSSAQNRDHLAILVNRENFTKVACLYEQVESKALRCERIAANINEEALFGLRNRSEAVCAENLEIVNSASGIKQIDELLQSIKKETDAKKLQQEDFDKLAESLNKKFPGSDSSVMDTALAAAIDVSKDYDHALTSNDNLREFLSQEGDGELTGTEMRSGRREIEKRKVRAQGVMNVLAAVFDADKKGTDMSEEDMKRVEEAMKAFDGDVLNFQGAYNEIMIRRATKGDDLGKELAAYNARLKDAGTFMEVKNMIDKQKRVSASPFDDGGRFIESKAAIQPHLQKMMEKEVKTLAERAMTLKDVPAGTPSGALRETLLTQEESVIYPLLRACSQLRSVSAENSKKNIMNVASSNEPNICRVFDCDDGAQTFEDYIKAHELTGMDPKKCTTECMSHYNRFICDQKQSLARSRTRVKREFVARGTICGKPLGQIFK